MINEVQCVSWGRDFIDMQEYWIQFNINVTHGIKEIWQNKHILCENTRLLTIPVPP